MMFMSIRINAYRVVPITIHISMLQIQAVAILCFVIGEMLHCMSQKPVCKSVLSVNHVVLRASSLCCALVSHCIRRVTTRSPRLTVLPMRLICI